MINLEYSNKKRDEWIYKCLLSERECKALIYTLYFLIEKKEVIVNDLRFYLGTRGERFKKEEIKKWLRKWNKHGLIKLKKKRYNYVCLN